MRTLKLNLILMVLSLSAVLGYWAWSANSYRTIANLDSSGSTIIAFGDSITYGTGVTPQQAWPALLQQEVGQEIINAGAPGETTEDALKRVDAILASHPRLVLLEFGGNDFLRQINPEVIAGNLSEIIRRLQTGGAMVIMLGVPSWQSQFEPEYRKIAKTARIVYIKNILKGIITHPELMADSIHPNAAGHALITRRLGKTVKSLLKAAQR